MAAVANPPDNSRQRRDYDNPYSDFDLNGSNLYIDVTTCEMLESFKTLLLEKAKQIMNEISVSERARDVMASGCSIYTGVTGIAIAALLAGRHIDPKYSEFAKDLLREIFSLSPSVLSGRRISFLNGDLGALTLSLINFEERDGEYKNLASKKMLGMLQSVKDPSSDFPDEILYGRAGFLYGMLYINKHLQQDVFSKAEIKEVIQCILIRGKSLSKKQRSLAPLMFEWHDKLYLGAAHGTVGILYVLLHARAYLTSDEISNLIRPTLDDLLSLRFPSGNLPSSSGNNSDRLVQWCHGAPGLVHLLVLSHLIFEDDSYLTAAETCSDVVWSRGMLKKGCGLCHGTAGNAYAFIALYHHYKAKGLQAEAAKHLYRACAFADWCLEYKKNRERVPDRPMSLFEGKSGILYFFLDMLEPESAAFPGFDL